jgi:hypothetical protein
MADMADVKFFYKFRQTSPTPAGRWVVCGPFDTREAAEIDRRRSKAWDCELTTPFAAISKEVAEDEPPTN